MRTAALSLIVAASALLAIPAHAQDTPAPPSAPAAYLPPAPSEPNAPGWDGDAWRQQPGQLYATHFQDGVRALDRKRFRSAERAFARYLEIDSGNAEANFYLGVTRMQLGQWEEATAPLQIALEKLPAHPDPKSRLGVTYAMLGDTAAAKAQRADLVTMAAACSTSCELAPYILGGIAMIDEALREAVSPG